MIIIKTFFPLLVLSLSALAQTVLSPDPCTLTCIQKSLPVTTCAQAQDGVSDPSVLPCLCEDKKFLRETIDCIVNSGECIVFPSIGFDLTTPCRTTKEQQDSFIYAIGLCKSNGIDLPGGTPADLPAALGVSSKPSTTTAFPTETSVAPETSTISETFTTMIAVLTSITCEPSHIYNANYTVVASNNITQTLFPKPTRRNCGNSTTTIPFTTTKKSTRTTTLRTPATVSSSTEATSISTSTDASGAQGTTIQSGFILALLGFLMCFV